MPKGQAFALPGHLTETQLATRWGISSSALNQSRRTNGALVPAGWVQPGGRGGVVHYPLSAIKEWERRHGIASGGDECGVDESPSADDVLTAVSEFLTDLLVKVRADERSKVRNELMGVLA